MRRRRITLLRLTALVVVGVLASAGVAYAASLGLSSKKLHAWSQTLTKGTCNQTSATADDTYVQQANPNSVAGGTDTTLTIGGAAGSQDYAFIRFDLSGCSLPTTAGADSAVLTLTVTSKSNDTISVFPVYSSWSSATLTWNTLGGVTIGADRDDDLRALVPRCAHRPCHRGRRCGDQGRDALGLGAPRHERYGDVGRWIRGEQCSRQASLDDPQL